jgi:hypothetical protein
MKDVKKQEEQINCARRQVLGLRPTVKRFCREPFGFAMHHMGKDSFE